MENLIVREALRYMQVPFDKADDNDKNEIINFYNELKSICSPKIICDLFNIEVGEKPSISELINIAFHMNMISLAGSHLTNTHQYPIIIEDIQVFYY